MSKTITQEELAKHNSEKDCWLAIHGSVYDVTEFLPDHPGGYEVMAAVAGKDATTEFEDIGHSTQSRRSADQYMKGVLEGKEEIVNEAKEKGWDGKGIPDPAHVGLQEEGTMTGVLVAVVVGAVACGAYYYKTYLA